MKQTPIKSTPQGRKGRKSNVSLNNSKQSENENDVSVKQNHNLPAVRGGKIGKMTPHKKTPVKKNKVELLLGSNEDKDLMKMVAKPKKTPMKKLQGKSNIEKSSKIENDDDEEVVTTLGAKSPKKMIQSKKNVKQIILRNADNENINEENDTEEEEDVDEYAANTGNGNLESDEEIDNEDDNVVDDDDDVVDDDEDVVDDDDDVVEDDDDDNDISLVNFQEADDDEQDDVASDEAEDEEEQDDDNDNVKKSSDKKSQITKLQKGQIPVDYPSEKIAHVTNIPKECKKVDILEAFSKFGPIYMINMMKNPVVCVANVAFQTVEAAQAAITSNKKIELQGSVLRITAHMNKKKKEETENIMKRTVCIKKLPNTTTENDLQKHFTSCGDIEKIELRLKNKMGFAFIRFKNENAVEKALLLDNSILNDHNIAVKKRSTKDKPEANYSEQDVENTIVIRNTQNLQSIDVQKLHDIFDKCGQIRKIKVICGANILAFITFNNSKAVEKAFTLDNTEQNGIHIKLEHCIPPTKTATFVANLAPDVTVEDLTKLFSPCGEIKSILLKRASAVVYFKNSDAFCKSFLLNEHRLKNRMIFLKPYSNLEKVALNASNANNRPQNMKRHITKPQHKFRQNGPTFIKSNNSSINNNKNIKRLKMSS